MGVGAAGDRTIYADRLAEVILLKRLGEVDGVRVLSEEAGDAGDPDGSTLAVVDPLDGSSNFERGIPFYCTSVAVAEGGTLDGILAGVVRDLVTGDAYSARRGGWGQEEREAHQDQQGGLASPRESFEGYKRHWPLRLSALLI